MSRNVMKSGVAHVVSLTTNVGSLLLLIGGGGTLLFGGCAALITNSWVTFIVYSLVGLGLIVAAAFIFGIGRAITANLLGEDTYRWETSIFRRR